MPIIDGKEYNLQILRGITNNRRILSCEKSGQYCDLFHRDDSTGRQRFKFELVDPANSVYHITVPNGIQGNREWLSVTEDGRKVDLFTHDDNTGRQRWIVTEVPNSPTPETYLIRAQAGTPADRTFLSVPSDGRSVDLFVKDDGSGRQRWQLQTPWATNE